MIDSNGIKSYPLEIREKNNNMSYFEFNSGSFNVDIESHTQYILQHRPLKYKW